MQDEAHVYVSHADGVGIFGPPSELFGWGAALAVGLGLWLLLARSSLVRGGSMERPERVPQLYGYAVCLIGIVVMLVTVGSIVDKVFTLADPLTSTGRYGWVGGASLTSFESYKATYERVMPPVPMVEGRPAERPRPTDAELRAQYQALRADQIARARHDARRELTGSALMFLLAAALFWWHWRWVRGAEVRALAARAAARE